MKTWEVVVAATAILAVFAYFGVVPLWTVLIPIVIVLIAAFFKMPKRGN